jgi:hypothetical protein
MPEGGRSGLREYHTHHSGTDLSKHNKSKQVFAGYHYDLNFLTIHGKARFPGLYVWLRDGRRIPVKVPEGCLLIQVSFGHVISAPCVCVLSTVVTPESPALSSGGIHRSVPPAILRLGSRLGDAVRADAL